MKRYKKIILLGSIALLCLSLAGCQGSGRITAPLKNQRAEHAVWKEKNDPSVILYNGAEYYPLPESSTLSYQGACARRIFLTNPDVPLLLRESEGNEIKISEDGKIILADHSYLNTFYCRADFFDEMQARLDKEFVPERYGYFNFHYDMPYYSPDYEREFIELTNEQEALLFDTLKTATPKEVSSFPKAERSGNSSIELYAERGFTQKAVIYGYSEDLLQEKEAMRIYELNGFYYLSDDTLNVHTVPAEHTLIVNAICAKAE